MDKEVVFEDYQDSRFWWEFPKDFVTISYARKLIYIAFSTVL